MNTSDIKKLESTLMKNVGVEINKCMQYKTDKCSPFECDDCTIDETNFMIYCNGLVGIMEAFTNICADKEVYMIYKHTLINTKLNFRCQQNITYDVSTQLELLSLYIDTKCNNNTKKKITNNSIINTARLYSYMFAMITLSLVL